MSVYLSGGKTVPRMNLSEARKKKLLIDFNPSPEYIHQIHQLIDFKALKTCETFRRLRT